MSNPFYNMETLATFEPPPRELTDDQKKVIHKELDYNLEILAGMRKGVFRLYLRSDLLEMATTYLKTLLTGYDVSLVSSRSGFQGYVEVKWDLSQHRLNETNDALRRAQAERIREDKEGK